MFLSKPRNNVFIAIKAIFQILGKKISNPTIQRFLDLHPNDLSILAIKDCLSEFDIESMVIKANKDKLLDTQAFPFIAHLEYPSISFVTVTNIADGLVVYIDGEGKEISTKLANFIKRWDGIKLIPTSVKTGDEPSYNIKNLVDWLSRLKLFGILILLLGYCSYSFVGITTNTAFVLVVICLFLGLTIGVFLLATSINSIRFLENICTFKDNFDCNSLLKSDAGRVNEWLSWSEVGFFYFSGSLLALMIDPSSIKYLFWLNLMSLPYTFYSIGYQYVKRQWCILCCSFQLALWMQFLGLLNYFSFVPPIGLNASTVIVLFLSFATVSIGWLCIREYLYNAELLPKSQKKLKTFKYDQNVFNYLVRKGTMFVMDEALTPIVLGNLNAKNVITIVSNPYCQPCSKAHKELEDLLERKENLQVRIVFYTGKKEGSNAHKISSHILSLWRNDDINKYEAISGWYGDKDKDLDRFINDYPLKFSDNEASNFLKLQAGWCENVGIVETPTIFLNGYILPNLYDLPELKFLID
ncbi:MAG: hypothetical protein EOO47_16725 [Flavobacterium sp.]|nr:MAG: hypothetical protein EOO47_16725 [Flavobacterium sp.]